MHAIPLVDRAENRIPQRTNVWALIIFALRFRLCILQKVMCHQRGARPDSRLTQEEYCEQIRAITFCKVKLQTRQVQIIKAHAFVRWGILFSAGSTRGIASTQRSKTNPNFGRRGAVGLEILTGICNQR